MDTGLAGRVVVVTGATANIGKATALAFAGEGAVVAVVGRDEAQGARVVDEARSRGAAGASFHRADVTALGEVSAMVAAVVERHGPVDVLVNNVGGNLDVVDFASSDPATWAGDIAVNLTSTLNCTHAVLPGMIERGAGRIVNIGSTSGIVGDPNLAVYSAMKGAVHTFTKVLAKEVGRHGITVNAVAPYGTLPDDLDADVSTGSRWRPDGVFARLLASRPEALAEMARRTVLERPMARPGEVAAAVLYLASEPAAFVTGHVLVVDGGSLIA